MKTIFNTLRAKAIRKLVLIAVAFITLFSLMYMYTLIPMWVVFVVFILFMTLFKRKVINRKMIEFLGTTKNFRNQTRKFSTTSIGDLFFEESTNCSVIKGIARFQGSLQTVLVKACDEGIVFNFIALAKDPVRCLEWNKISKIFVGEVDWEGSCQLSAEILLKESEELIIFPWNDEFTGYIPPSIGIEELNFTN